VYLLEENPKLQVQVASMLNCKVGKFPITYLGIFLRPSKLHKLIGNLCLIKILDSLDGRALLCHKVVD